AKDSACNQESHGSRSCSHFITCYWTVLTCAGFGSSVVLRVGTGLQAGGSNPIDEGVVQEWLLDDTDMRLLGAIDHGGTPVTGDENRRRQDPSLPQFCDQVEACHPGHILIDDEAAAVGRICRIQQVGAACIGAHRKPLDLK